MYLVIGRLLVVLTVFMANSAKVAPINTIQEDAFTILTEFSNTTLTLDYDCLNNYNPPMSRDDCAVAIDNLQLESPRKAPPETWSGNISDPRYRVPRTASHRSCRAFIFLNRGAVTGVAEPRDLRLIFLGLNGVCNSPNGPGRGGAALTGDQNHLLVGLYAR